MPFLLVNPKFGIEFHTPDSILLAKLTQLVLSCFYNILLETHIYGSLYVTLCFVICRFDFGVLTFYFRILSFLLCVLCTMLFILNGAIHEVETRYRRKDGRKTKL